jgi:hypothetical protein
MRAPSATPSGTSKAGLEALKLTNHRAFGSTGALLDIKPTAGPFQP